MLPTVHILAVGLIAAAILLSGHMALFGRPLSFFVYPHSAGAKIAYGLALAFAGPAILIRNSWRGLRIEGRPMGFVCAGVAIALFWSFLSGVVILQGVDGVTQFGV